MSALGGGNSDNKLIIFHFKTSVMNKIKILIAALALSMALGACVDDKESASVEKMREAKTALMAADADYKKAQAEAAKILAEAEKLKAENEKIIAEAQAKLLEAQAALAAAQTEIEKAKAEAELRKLNQEIEQQKMRFEIELQNLRKQAEMLAAQYDAQLQNYLNELAEAKRQADAAQQTALITAIGEYQQALVEVRKVERKISDKTIAIAEKQQLRLEALSNGKKTVEEEIEGLNLNISVQNKILTFYKTLNSGTIEERAQEIEKLRSSLDQLKEAMSSAQTASEEAQQKSDAAWQSYEEANRVLNTGGPVYDDAGNQIGYEDSKRDSMSNAFYNLYNRLNSWGIINYYPEVIKEYEVDKLMSVVKDRQLALENELTVSDTLEQAETTAQKWFENVEKREKEQKDAQTALEKATEEVNAAWEKYRQAEDALTAAQAGGDADAIAAAQKARDEAYAAYDAKEKARVAAEAAVRTANNAYWNAKNLYDQKKAANQNLKYTLENLKDQIEYWKAEQESIVLSKEVYFRLQVEIPVLEKDLAEKEKAADKFYYEYRNLNGKFRIARSEYVSAINAVNAWDLGNDQFVQQMIDQIKDTEEMIAGWEKDLAFRQELLANPEQLEAEYCKQIDKEIELLQKQLENLKTDLELAKQQAAARKAIMDGLMEE